MSADTIRAHVSLPRELVEAVDRLVGQRQRSDFVAAALMEKLTRQRFLTALEQAAGIIRAEDYPEWATPELTSQWVHDQRQADDAHRRSKRERQ